MPWVIGGAILGSAVLGGAAASEQAGAAEQASSEELAFRREMWEADQARQEPYMEAGRSALAQMAGGQIDIAQDPGYQFRVAEGEKMLERQLAGMGGGATSGRGMMEAVRRGQEMGSQEYGAAYNRLASMAGLGQTAGAQLGQTGAQATPGIAGAISGGIMGPAQAQSSMYSGLGDLAMQGANIYQQQNYLSSMAQPSMVPGDAYMPAYGGY